MSWLKTLHEIALVKPEITVEDVHREFNTESERLLEEAKYYTSVKFKNKELVYSGDLAKQLGFTGSINAQWSDEERERLRDIRKENEEKKKLSKALLYFATKYPKYRFITEESIGKICKKYGLVFGRIEWYTGVIPMKNLKDIEKFKIDVSDMYEPGYKSGSKIIAGKRENFRDNLELQGTQLKKKSPPDPVVFQPVKYEHKKYFLIITAWGPEAEDELVKMP